MKYNPYLHKRKSIRLKNFDYSSPNDYFITICTKDRRNLFGKIKDNKMVLNEIGKVVREEIIKTPEIRKSTNIDVFQIMPNHLHLILSILERICRGDPSDRPIEDDNIGFAKRATHRVAPTLKSNTIGSIIGQFKSIVTKKIRKNGFYDFEWQRGFYDHIIRNEKSYSNIYDYVNSNISSWQEDLENLEFEKSLDQEERNKKAKEFYKRFFL